MAPVALQDADAAEISGVASVRRGNDAGESDRRGLMKSEPPLAPVERRNGGAAQESQAMQFGEDVGDLVVASVYLANAVGQDLRHRFARSMSFGENPLARANASAAASPYCATARLTTQHGMASAGEDVTSTVNSNIA